MATAVDLIMFIVPLLLAVLFSVFTIVPKGKDSSSKPFSGGLITFFSSLTATICWFIFALTWPALATSDLFVSVAYLWYAIGAIFGIFTLVTGIKMLGAMGDVKPPPKLVLKLSDEGTDE